MPQNTRRPLPLLRASEENGGIVAREFLSTRCRERIAATQSLSGSQHLLGSSQSCPSHHPS